MPDLIERLRDAQNAHDLDAFVACFDPRYRSEQGEDVEPGQAIDQAVHHMTHGSE